MAKAIKEEVRTVETTVTLTLTLEEALTLKAVVGSIVGSETKSRRKHTTDIYNALGDVGIKFEHSVSRLVKGTIHFPDEDGIDE